MDYLKAKKSLGQHFLIDRNIAGKIVHSLKLQGISKVLEIGPGMGILTEFLVNRNEYETFVIEIDKEYTVFLNEKFPELQSRLINEDFLKFRTEQYFSEPLAIIGNLPYNISSQILFRILELKDCVGEAVIMLQKEVAERIKADPGNKTYGILSVLVQSFYKVEYLFTVGESVFRPRPKVRSAVLRLTRMPDSDPECNEELFFRVVKTAFNQRRKILKNSLKDLIMPGIEDEILAKRPEQLSNGQFCYLTNIIDKSETRNPKSEFI